MAEYISDTSGDRLAATETLKTEVLRGFGLPAEQTDSTLIQDFPLDTIAHSGHDVQNEDFLVTEVDLDE